MSIVLDAVLEANRKYAETFGSKSELPIPPGRKFAIVTCMDARLDPAKFAGLAEGDAHVIRNAGGRVNEEDDPFPHHLPQAAGDAGVVRHPPHGLRHADLHQPGDV